MDPITSTATPTPRSKPDKRKSRGGDNNQQQHSTKKKPRPATAPPSLDLELATVTYLYPPSTPHLRKLAPYYYSFSTYAKGRWLNQPLLAMFDKEFADRPLGYYQRAIETGLITVNGERKPLDYVIRNQDLIAHRNHRHEPPVTSQPVKVLAISNEYCIVDKPSSIPVHPTGRYRHNTLIHLVQYYWNEWTAGLLPPTSESSSSSNPAPTPETQGQGNDDSKVKSLGPTLYPIHRLDRLTSGVLLLCHSRPLISTLTSQFQSQVVGKEYLARVRGHFPTTFTECAEPIQVLHHKLGLSHVHPEGKHARTLFEFVAYRADLGESLVKVRPVTGRTHQIRVHLRHLGYPITNDPVYNNPGHRHVVKDLDAWVRATQVGSAVGELEASTETDISKANMQGWRQDKVQATDEVTQAWVQAVGDAKLAADKQIVGACDECGSDLIADPEPHDMFLYLHAFKYSVAGDLGLSPSQWVGVKDGITTIRTPVPEWAKEEGWGTWWEGQEGDIEAVVVKGAGGEEMGGD
ncbi:pseudouridine synthase, partial [Catenaria anguillulae PL171]